jgi:hypothetical protein
MGKPDYPITPSMATAGRPRNDQSRRAHCQDSHGRQSTFGKNASLPATTLLNISATYKGSKKHLDKALPIPQVLLALELDDLNDDDKEIADRRGLRNSGLHDSA